MKAKCTLNNTLYKVIKHCNTIHGSIRRSVNNLSFYGAPQYIKFILLIGREL